VRKRKKFFGNYILVKKRNGKVFIRKYPRDYEMWNKTKDLKHIHPNKIKTWLGLSKVAQKVRGLDYDSSIQTFIRELYGRKYKEDVRIKVLPLIDIAGLKLQAIEKGVPTNIVDELVVPEEFVKLKEKPKMEKIKEALEGLKHPLRAHQRSSTSTQAPTS